MKVAVFDVCGTLYDSNTTFDFLDDFFKDNKKYLLFRKLSKTPLGKIVNYPFYRLLKYDLVRSIATGYLKGIDENELSNAAKTFVYQYLSKKVNANIKELLEEHKENGFIIVLMSGSYSIIVEHVCDYCHADNFFASELEVVDSLYTGKYKLDQLFNKKDILLNKYQNITELVVVSDNRTDYELMQRADKGYAVCNKHKQALFWKSMNLSHVEIIS